MDQKQKPKQAKKSEKQKKTKKTRLAYHLKIMQRKTHVQIIIGTP